MKQNKAENRATLSGKATNILEARTLANSHQRLAELVTEGMTVLDVGCGTGAITKDIAHIVGPRGKVVGIDSNDDLIHQAQKTYNHIANLKFHTRSIYDVPYENTFDIVTCARVLQWLDDPKKAIMEMKKATKPDGKVLVLDYNHEKITWNPSAPEAMQHFYEQFLKWRADAGMDNTIADKLKDLFNEIDLKNIQVTEQHEKATKTNNTAGLYTWADVAASRGIQMVADGYITENERANAEMLFSQWIDSKAKAQTMYLLAVEGDK